MIYTCPCCLDNININNLKEYVALQCDHFIHFKCLINWMKSTDISVTSCAYCRKTLSSDFIKDYDIYSDCRKLKVNMCLFISNNGSIYKFNSHKDIILFILNYRKTNIHKEAHTKIYIELMRRIKEYKETEKIADNRLEELILYNELCNISKV